MQNAPFEIKHIVAQVPMDYVELGGKRRTLDYFEKTIETLREVGTEGGGRETFNLDPHWIEECVQTGILVKEKQAGARVAGAMGRSGEIIMPGPRYEEFMTTVEEFERSLGSGPAEVASV